MCHRFIIITDGIEYEASADSLESAKREAKQLNKRCHIYQHVGTMEPVTEYKFSGVADQPKGGNS